MDQYGDPLTAMPIAARPRPASRYGQATLDPSRPLFVRRRISRGAMAHSLWCRALIASASPAMTT